MKVHQRVVQLQVIPGRVSQHSRKGKVTCVTCNLKHCIGRCRWETTPVRKAE